MYINDGIVEGKIPTKIVKKVAYWLEVHREELLADWELSQKGEELFKIDPLT